TRGVIATFDDITELERKNTELSETVTKLRDSECEVRLRVEELHRLATRDPLTGCFNRRSFFDAFESLFLEAKRDKLELSCIMTDIDHFKSVNDTHGHAVGDEAIKFLAELLRSTSRSQDIVGRYGGEEFCVLLPGLNSEQASAVAERIRIAVQQESAIRFASAPRFTASFGVSTLSDGAQGPKELTEKADQALYRAKRCGRNRVIRWSINQGSGTAEDTAVDGDTRGSCLATIPVATKDRGNTEMHPVHLDELSGLPAELLFYNRVVYAIAHGQRYNKINAVLSLQIDQPRHPSIAYENILTMVSSRLAGILRRTDLVENLGMEKSPPMVSRFQPNEFGILLAELDHTDSVTWVVKRILDKLSEPVSISGDPVCLTTSIGISVYPQDGETPETLIANARAARERATGMGGRTRYQFFSRESNERAWHRMLMENQLRRAIDNDELEVHYQPKVHIATRTITGFEALVRWDHPERGLLCPDEFIPLAENSGLIAPLGKWVLRTACQQAKEWLNHFPDLRVAVNLSALQFDQTNICQEVQEILDATGLEPCHLELEITESAIMRDADKAALTLRDLSKRGVKITIDDFGTGYSSLNYLRAFPVDSFKIDRSFLKDVSTDERARALYTAIAAMAKSLGLQVVAEGVELQEQLNFVRQAQCDEVQGYLISEPVPGNDVAKLLIQHISGSSSPLHSSCSDSSLHRPRTVAFPLLGSEPGYARTFNRLIAPRTTLADERAAPQPAGSKVHKRS
ncbi:MAG: bifunctional diguanylate cyclase/phosphodiesterase, partial [Gammaproteobacteria bacterium]